MRVRFWKSGVFFAPAAILCAGTLGADGRPVPLLEVRLMTAVSSRTSKAGMPVNAVVIAPYRAGDGVIPAGTLVHGRLRFAKKVGLGLVRETAKMALDFTELEPASGPEISIVSRLAEVDNARERVDRKGVIRGIRATESYSHRVGYRFLNLAMEHPAGFVPLLVLQTCIFHFPNPEIEYPAGTDLKLELQEPLPADAGDPRNTGARVGYCRVGGIKRAGPSRAVLGSIDGKKDPVDIVNLVFLGSEDAIQGAFEAAGWTAPRPVSATARLSVMRAGAELRALPDAPMRTPDDRRRGGGDELAAIVERYGEASPPADLETGGRVAGS